MNEGVFGFPGRTSPPSLRFNRRKFSANGTFVVPLGVSWVLATVIAGGGGSSADDDQNSGSAGGTSSFGTFISCTGGTGGVAGNGSQQAAGVATFAASVIDQRTGATDVGAFVPGGANSVARVSPGANGNRAGIGGHGAGMVPVTPGQSIAITVGAAGANAANGSTVSAGPGVVLVEWLQP